MTNEDDIKGQYVGFLLITKTLTRSLSKSSFFVTLSAKVFSGFTYHIQEINSRTNFESDQEPLFPFQYCSKVLGTEGPSAPRNYDRPQTHHRVNV